MWTCESCGRSFMRDNQDHYCGEPPKTVDAYIAAQPEAVRPLLFQVRDVLRKTLPNAEERISWRMPTYWQKRNVIHFAAFQKHMGVYPGEKAMEHFSSRLTDYKTSKGAIQFPYNKPVPLELIAEIAKWCCGEDNPH